MIEIENITSHCYKVLVRCYTYNHGQYIQDALNGFAMQQTNFPFVCLVMDDCSTDGEQEVIKAYLDRECDMTRAEFFEDDTTTMTLVPHRTNVNCTFAVYFLKKNLYGVQGAKAVYVNPWREHCEYEALCEGDDYWTDPYKLYKQVDFLENHEDFCMVSTAFTQIFEDSNRPIDVVSHMLDEISLNDILQGLWVGTLTVMYRYEALVDYKPPFEKLPFGDLPMWCHLATKGRIKYLQDVTSCYRSLANSACHFSDQQKQFAFTLDVMRVREYYALRTNKLKLVQPFFAKNVHYILDECFNNRYIDFPLEMLWHFMKDYGKPSGYDRMKYWGLKSKWHYFFAEKIIHYFRRLRDVNDNYKIVRRR